MAGSATNSELYRALGLPDPEGWASVAAEYGGGVEHLARATLLRAFADIAMSAAANPAAALKDAMGSHVETAAARLAALGAGDRRVIAGAIAWSVLQEVCTLLSGATEAETNPGDVLFGVFSEDEDENPGQKLEVLHEDWRGVAAALLGEEIVAG